jgi:hypothetical protein
VTKPVKVKNGDVHQVIHTSNRHGRNRTAVELERKRHEGTKTKEVHRIE